MYSPWCRFCSTSCLLTTWIIKPCKILYVVLEGKFYAFLIFFQQQASPAAQSIQRFLLSHLNSSDDEMKTTCVEGFAKLMLADVVMDKKVL